MNMTGLSWGVISNMANRINHIRTGKKVPCATCGNMIYRKGYLLKTKKNFFCNNKCHAKFKKTKDYSWCTKENHWNWKGGISFIGKSLYKQLRKIKKYTDWRSDIYKRDNYTCVNCGVVGGKLNVDHCPKPFSLIIKENNIKTLEEAISCGKLWDINNGRTLCVDCHLKIGFRGSHIIKDKKT